MLNTSDYLIPLRFTCLMLQSIFSLSAFLSRVYFNYLFNNLYLLYKLQSSNIEICEDTHLCKIYITTFSAIIFATEFLELVMQFLGITLFQNKLSLLLIIFHTLATMLYLWYIFLDWPATRIWIIWLLGSLIPAFLEAGGFLYSYLFYIKVLRLNQIDIYNFFYN